MPLQISNSRHKTKDDPLKLTYIKTLRTFMYPLGLWPGAILGQQELFLTKIATYISIPLCTAYLIGELYFIKHKFEEINFPVIIDALISMSLTLLTLLRMALPFFKEYHVLFAKYIQEFHLIHYKNKSEFHNHIYKTVEKLSKRFTHFMVVIMWIGLLLFNIAPTYNNYKNGVFANAPNVSKEFAVILLLPGFDPQNHFYLVSTVNFYASICCSISVVLVDLLMSLMVFNMIGHIKILINNIKELKNFNEEEDIVGVTTSRTFCKLFNSESNDLITARLKMCVDDHRFIIKFAKKMTNFFGPLLAVNYLLHLFACCLLLFQCSLAEPDTLARFGVLTAIIFGQLIQTSMIFEFIGTVSEELPFELYAIPWEQMNISNRRIILLMLQRTQEPICVYAIGTVKVGVKTMTEILKTTFSYFMFLTSKND